MSRGATLIKNTLILGLGTISTQFVGFFLLPLYTRYLSPDEFGFVDVVTVLLSLLVPALTLQLHMASFRFLVDARGNHEEQVRVISNITAMVVMLALPWILIFVLAGFIVEIPHIQYIVFAGVAMLLSQQSLQLTRGLGNNMQFAMASIITGLVTLIGAVIFIVWLGLRVEGMLLSVAIANVTASLYLILKMRLLRYLKRGQKDSALRRELVGYSVPLVPNGLAWWVNNAADRVLIVMLIGTAANGLYAVSTKFSAVLNSIFGVFSMSWTESASIHINEPDRDEFFSLVANSTVRLFGTLGLGLIAAMPFLFPIMVDSKYGEAYIYIPIMVVGVFFNVIVGIYSGVYIAKRLTKQVMNTSLIAAALNIVLTLALVPFIGLFGAAAATSLTYLLMAVLRHFDVKKYVSIHYDRGIFILLGILCILVAIPYYLNIFWLNLLNLVFVIVVAFLLNWRQIRLAKGLLIKKNTN